MQRSRYSFGDFGKMNASLRGYFLTHGQVCDGIKKKDLKQALTAAAGVDDLGIKGQTYEAVIVDANMLQNFQTALNALKGKMAADAWGNPLYVDETIKIGNELLATAIAAITSKIGPSIISPEEEDAILQQTLPLPPIEASFLARNAKPLIIGGAALVLGTLGMIIMIKI